eukprot:TRINITY_DN35179_c0_g1_i1.p1 TRINITY_DN35179_c0_g1~~TRINITY_DN35179_c0_g1_i1.p1  ORF type:complete len:394 (+),score=147.52 TRINITY_DN35179_c0_g1_i1:62-1183(+)
MGAEVIKVERPGGDPWRGDRANKLPESNTGGPHFTQNNRGKKSIVLDLKDPAHMEAMLKLLKTADVFITNVRYQSLQKTGLDYETLKKLNPRLVYAILTAWGMDGAQKNDPGYDVGAFWAASGLQDFSKPTNDGHVGQFPPGIGDHMTALQLLSGVALALWHRDKTGYGQFVEASLLRSGIWGMAYPLLNTALNPEGAFIREPRTNHYRPTFNVYKCRDGVWLQLLGLDIGRFDEPLCKALGLPFADIKGLSGPEQIQRFDAAFIQHDSAHWEQRLKANNVWYQRAMQLDEVLRSQQARDIGSFVSVPGVPHPLITSPVTMSAGNGSHGPKGGAPVCGDHTVSVLTEVGVASDEARRIDASSKKWVRSKATSD